MLLLCTKCSLASTMATIPQNPSRANHSSWRFIIFHIREAFKCTKAAWQLRQILSSPKRILILALYIWWKYISEKQRTCQLKAHTSSSVELLAPQRGTYENWALTLQCQGDFTEHIRKVSLSWPETQGKEMRVIMYSWASTVQRLLNQWYGVHCWCSVVKMFTICVTLSLLWTLMEPSNIKSMGVGNKNTTKPKYLKITSSCILHKEILTPNEKWIKTKTRALPGWAQEGCTALAYPALEV